MDKHVHVTFYKKIRDEKKFSTTNEWGFIPAIASTDIKDCEAFF